MKEFGLDLQHEVNQLSASSVKQKNGVRQNVSGAYSLRGLIAFPERSHYTVGASDYV
jgi:hypothetical protein